MVNIKNLEKYYQQWARSPYY